MALPCHVHKTKRPEFRISIQDQHQDQPILFPDINGVPHKDMAPPLERFGRNAWSPLYVYGKHHL